MRIGKESSVKITAENGCVFLEKADGEQPEGGRYYIRKVDDLFRVVIPQKYRTLLHIEEGENLYERVEDNRIAISKMTNKPVCQICGKTDHLSVLTAEQCAFRDCIIQALSCMKCEGQ